MLNFLLNNTKPLNILCLGAHCDDIEIGAGGTLLKIIDNNNINEVKWVVFSSNEIRKAEATDSALQFLGSVKNHEIIVHAYRDGFLPFNAADVKDKFEELKRAFQPDLIFTHYRDDRHQDHRLVSDLTWNTWRNHLIFEYEIPKYDGDIGNPNFYMPLEETYINRRNEILMSAFGSQRDKHWFDDETFKALPRLRGMESACKYAEAFFARKMVL